MAPIIPDLAIKRQSKPFGTYFGCDWASAIQVKLATRGKISSKLQQIMKLIKRYVEVAWKMVRNRDGETRTAWRGRKKDAAEQSIARRIETMVNARDSYRVTWNRQAK
jgi:hypothetical protein